MSVVVNGVTAFERWENYAKGRSDRGPQVTKEYLINFGDGDTFVDAVMGGCSSASGQGGAITYSNRHQCPENPGLIALDAHYRGIGETTPHAGGRPTYTHAVATVTYGVLAWDQQQSEDPQGDHSFPNETAPGQPHVYAIQEIDFSDEFVTIPTGTMMFSSDSKKIDAPLGMHIARATMRMVRKNVPYLPTNLIISLMNGINDATFLGRDRGQVLFKGAKTHREAVSDGTKVQEVELVFEWREYDWNKFLRPDGFTFDTVVDGSGNKPYTYRDLKPLIT